MFHGEVERRTEKRGRKRERERKKVACHLGKVGRTEADSQSLSLYIVACYGDKRQHMRYNASFGSRGREREWKREREADYGSGDLEEHGGTTAFISLALFVALLPHSVVGEQRRDRLRSALPVGPVETAGGKGAAERERDGAGRRGETTHVSSATAAAPSRSLRRRLTAAQLQQPH